MSKPSGRILDTDRIHQLVGWGWSNAQIAGELRVPTSSISQSRRVERVWDYDPTLRARWEARMPRIKAALLAEIERDQR